MKLYTIIVLILFLLVFFCFKRITFRAIHLSKLVLPVLGTVFILCLIFFSKTVVSSALKGINLWLDIVFPSLFPFFVGSELLNKTGLVRAMGILLEPVMRPLFNVPGCGSFAFVMGVTSGYPVGAKITTGMREEKLLTKTEAERLLAFTNNSGPLFIIGAVSVGMFKKPEIGLFMLGCHIAACITVGILFRFYGKKEKNSEYKYNKQLLRKFRDELFYPGKGPSGNFGSLFGDAIRNSVNMMLAIGGFIIFFSVIINILLDTGIIYGISNILSSFLTPLGISAGLINSLLSGFFEITTGTNMASSAAGASFIQQITAASIIIGWAGLSVHSQVLSIVSSTDISIKPYLLGKFMQGIIAAGYTYLIIKTTGIFIQGAAPAFLQQHGAEPSHWYDYMTLSFKYLAISLVLLIIGLAVSLIVNQTLRKLKKLH